MDQIIEDIYLGDIYDASDHEALRERDVTHVLTVTHANPERSYPDDVDVLNVPLIDGPQNDVKALREAVESLLDLHEARATVFVHCAAGASRSVSVTAAALALQRDLEIAEAFDHVSDRHPASDPHPALIRHAKQVVEQLREP